MDDEEPTQEEIDSVTSAMDKYGGGFVKRLGHAISYADNNNRRRIKKAFPEYWERYLNMGKSQE